MQCEKGNRCEGIKNRTQGGVKKMLQNPNSVFRHLSFQKAIDVIDVSSCVTTVVDTILQKQCAWNFTLKAANA